jgi:fumarate reductase flavoprotein subunit
MADYVVGVAERRGDAGALERAVRDAQAPLGRSGGDLYELQRRLRDVMWEHAGLVRDARGLRMVQGAIDEIERQLETAGVPGGTALNLAWQDWLNVRSQLTAARLIIASALERTESRGAHWRDDFPTAARDALYSVRARQSGDELTIWREPVALTRARPDTATPTPEAVEIGD